MEQSTLFELATAVEGLHSDTHEAWEALPDPSDVDAGLEAFRKIRDRLVEWFADQADGGADLDRERFDDVIRDFDQEIADHADNQDRAQTRLETAVDKGGNAIAWADELLDRYDTAAFDAMWAEVDRARALIEAPFVPAVDCPKCHRESMGSPVAAMHDHDTRCPRRPAPPVTIDPATGLPPRPLSKSAVFDRLDALTAREVAPVVQLDSRRPAAVPCTLCRTGRGKKHGRGCPRSARRRA